MRTICSSGHISGGGTCLGGRGVYLPGGVPAQGVYLAPGGAPGQVLPPVDRHTPVKT